MTTEVVFINLDRVPERRRFMEAEFRKAGLSNASRFPAIDAKANSALDSAGFRPGVGDRWELPLSAIACFESHRAVWKLALDQKLETIAVFEDDLLLSPKLPRILGELSQCRHEFDVVKIDRAGGPAKYGPLTQLGSLPVRELLTRAPSAGGYVLSRDGAKKLLERSALYGDTLDDFIFTRSPNWRMYQLFPAAAVQVVNLNSSDVELNKFRAQKVNEGEREADPEINKKNLVKGPVWFRLRKELKRGMQRLIWSFGGRALLSWRGGFCGLVPLDETLEGKKN